MLGNSNPQGLEGLRDELFFAVLSSQSEDIYDHDPSTLDESCLHGTDVCKAHDYVFLDVGPGVQVVQHYPLKWFQEIFLEVEACKFFLDQELVCKLSQRIDGENCYHQICMGPDPYKVFTKHLPYFRPYESDSCHVQVCYFHNSLQTELPWVHGVRKFLFRNFAKVLNETNDCILVQIDATHENSVKLGY